MLYNYWRRVRQLVRWLRDDWQDYPGGVRRRFRTGREEER